MSDRAAALRSDPVWFSTPGGVMRQLEAWPTTGAYRGRDPGHWYIDRDQKFHAYPDADIRRTRPPAWYRRESVGVLLLEARREARKIRNA